MKTHFSKASQLKPHLGKIVEWEHAHDLHRGTCLVSSGRLEAVQGRNLLVSGEYRWFSHMVALRLKEPTETAPANNLPPDAK